MSRFAPETDRIDAELVNPIYMKPKKLGQHVPMPRRGAPSDPTRAEKVDTNPPQQSIYSNPITSAGSAVVSAPQQTQATQPPQAAGPNMGNPNTK